jgi:hypothetical protein
MVCGGMNVGVAVNMRGGTGLLVQKLDSGLKLWLGGGGILVEGMAMGIGREGGMLNSVGKKLVRRWNKCRGNRIQLRKCRR